MKGYLEEEIFLDTLCIENFNEITLFCTVKANLCFSILGKNSKIKMAAICGEGKIFLKLQRSHSLDTLWVENFDEIALSRTVKEIEANLCFAIFGKNSKCAPFLGRGKFLENCKDYIP